MALSVAIVGGGLTGSLVAHQLSQAGFSTTLFEKSAGLGGRASTKQMPWGQFDLGVPLIPATDKHFIDFMDQLVLEGRAHCWPEPEQQIFRRFATDNNIHSKFYVFDGKMNSICQHWLVTSHFQAHSLVTNVRYHQGRGWQLCINKNWHETFFDVLICTAPWPQTRELLKHTDLNAILAEQSWASCWSVGIKLLADIKPQKKVIHIENNPLQTLIFDSEKPNRPALQDSEQIWVAQLNHQLSANLGKDGKVAAISLACDSLCQFFNLPSHAILHAEGHFWRFARSEKGQEPMGIIHHQASNLIAGGDWSFGASVQSAFKASQAITEKVLQIR